MKSLIYWVVFQMLMGIWLVISPFVMEFREMKDVSANNTLVEGLYSFSAWGLPFMNTIRRERMFAVSTSCRARGRKGKNRRKDKRLC